MEPSMCARACVCVYVWRRWGGGWGGVARASNDDGVCVCMRNGGESARQAYLD